ncbi:hypothetical protein [Gilvimarinus sp. DA14]|uniref:hypothetical protein n=1 Tax=Gilvimarinus sp. DA14 TaxID=2956798 RepID=UPI0020B805B3|nr:hypothetical protein [Gilvimarinus sp. DA14]UTF61571.1 hypothetical protein NHM04_07185 [Gilvimarinus sp. DA14]
MDELVSLAREYVADNPNWLVRFEAYQRSRGEFSDADYESYRDYDEPTLEAMLEGGDMLAGQVLAQRAEKLGRDKIARHYWHLAAVLGSVEALQKLSDSHFVNYQKARHSDDSTAASRAKMDYFVLLDILARRGEESPGRAEFLAQQGISLSAQEQELVEQRAQSYYQLLLNQRQSRGLGEFAPPQDLMPEEIKKRLPSEPFVENDL